MVATTPQQSHYDISARCARKVLSQSEVTGSGKYFHLIITVPVLRRPLDIFAPCNHLAAPNGSGKFQGGDSSLRVARTELICLPDIPTLTSDGISRRMRILSKLPLPTGGDLLTFVQNSLWSRMLPVAIQGTGASENDSGSFGGLPSYHIFADVLQALFEGMFRRVLAQRLEHNLCEGLCACVCVCAPVPVSVSVHVVPPCWNPSCHSQMASHGWVFPHPSIRKLQQFINPSFLVTNFPFWFG